MLTAGGYIEGGDEEKVYRVTQNVVQGKGSAVRREGNILPAQQHPFWDWGVQLGPLNLDA